MKFIDLKIAAKQKVVFSIILLILIAAISYTIHVMRMFKDKVDEVTLNRLPRAIAVSNFNFSTAELRLNQLQVALAKEKIPNEQWDALFNELDLNFDRYVQLKEESEQKKQYSLKEEQLFEEFDSKWGEYQDFSISFFQLYREKKIEEANALINGKEANAVFNDLNKVLVELAIIDQQEAVKAAQVVDVTLKSTRFVVLVFILSAIILSIVMVGVLVRYITNPVQQLEKAAKSVADGNLSVKLDVKSKDEIGSLACSFNQMTDSLKTAIDRTKLQARRLKSQNDRLQTTSNELEEKSQILEKQKSEILQKNLDLYSTMEQLKSTQEQLVLKEKMASLGNLVAGVAHEVNTPIGAVHSAADVIKRCIDRIKNSLISSRTLTDLVENKPFQDSLKILEENNNVTTLASKRVTKIVKSLRIFARLDESDYQKSDVHEGIESTLTLVHHKMKDRISVVKEYGEIPEINCYPNQLNQVFMNILMNAAQAIEGKGTITIKTQKDDANVFITFSDSGKGIPKEILKNIFDPGFTTKGVGVGTGLGLAISYNIIQKHKGDIEVSSIPNMGTTFKIKIPLNLNKNLKVK